MSTLRRTRSSRLLGALNVSDYNLLFSTVHGLMFDECKLWHQSQFVKHGVNSIQVVLHLTLSAFQLALPLSEV